MNRSVYIASHNTTCSSCEYISINVYQFIKLINNSIADCDINFWLDEKCRKKHFNAFFTSIIRDNGFPAEGNEDLEGPINQLASRELLWLGSPHYIYTKLSFLSHMIVLQKIMSTFVIENRWYGLQKVF